MFTIILICSFVALCNCAGNTYLPPFETSSHGSTGFAEDSGSYVVDAKNSFSNRHGSFSSGFSSGRERSAQTVRYNNDNDALGRFQYSYETDNKIRHDESGELKQFGSESAVVVRGSYSYVAPDGQLITVNYVADENGYRAEGNHLPTPPPIPDAILKSLKSGHDWSSLQTK